MKTGTLTTLAPEPFFEEAKKHRLIIDLRTEKQHLAGTIPGAFNFPYGTVQTFLCEKVNSTPLFMYCSDGKRSGRIARHLKQRGFTIFKLRGGYQAWKKYY